MEIGETQDTWATHGEQRQKVLVQAWCWQSESECLEKKIFLEDPGIIQMSVKFRCEGDAVQNQNQTGLQKWRHQMYKWMWVEDTIRSIDRGWVLEARREQLRWAGMLLHTKSTVHEWRHICDTYCNQFKNVTSTVKECNWTRCLSEWDPTWKWDNGDHQPLPWEALEGEAMKQVVTVVLCHSF